MVVFRMCRTFFVLLKCTIQGGPEVDVLLIAFLHLWLKFWDGIDKYCIVPVRKLFYFRHWLNHKFFSALDRPVARNITLPQKPSSKAVATEPSMDF